MESGPPQDTVSRLQKESIAGGPVTCVSFLSKSLICLTRGSFLELVDTGIHHHQQPRRHLVFSNGGTIYGVKHDERVMFVFGGRQVAVLHRSRDEDDSLVQTSICWKQQVSDTLIVSDWIWDLQIMNQVDDGTTSQRWMVAMGLANNACDLWLFQSTTNCECKSTCDVHRLRHVVGSIRSITYSMNFFGWNSSCKDLILAAGTVSNEILVWTVVAREETERLSSSLVQEPVSCTTLTVSAKFRLRGHEGVIHSVQFGNSGDYLASTSDDRSVRMWKRATEDGEWKLLWTGWSHTARVWNVAFSTVGVVSCGEDSSAKVWNLKDGSLLGEVCVHSCQCLWSIDVTDDLAVIGCNDGTAKFWNLRSRIVRKALNDSDQTEHQPDHCASFATFLVPDDRDFAQSTAETPEATDETIVDESVKSAVMTRTGKKKKSRIKEKGQVVFGVQFYTDENSSRKLLVPTRSGSLFSLDLASRSWGQLEPWCVLPLNVRAIEGSCTTVHGAGGLVAVGTTRGDIVMLSLCKRSVPPCNVRRRHCNAQAYLSIKRLVWLNDNTLLSFHIKGIVILWNFPGDVDILGFEHLVDGPQMVLKMPSEEVPTCCAYSALDNRLLVGDSRGNVAAFGIEDSSDENEIAPSSYVRRLHRKEHVSDILYLRGGKIVSVGNDGCLRYSLITEGGVFQALLEIPLASIPGPCHLYLTERGNGEETVFVAGYHGNTFLGLDASSGYELFRIDSGGRQRAHACFLDLKTNDSSRCFPFAYGIAICAVKTGGRNEILLQSFLSTPAGPTRTPEAPELGYSYTVGACLHGEPVFDLCLFQSRPRASYSVLLTGSEDCTARVSIVQDHAVTLSFPLPSQPSCIRAVCCSRRYGSNCTLLVVCGGKMTIQFYSLTDNNIDSPSAPIMDATTMDSMVIRGLGTASFSSKPSIDHRVNAVKAVPLVGPCGGSSYLVVAGDSNGAVHVFTVNESDPKKSISGTLLCQLERPVLSIEVIVLHTSTSSDLFVAAGTSDGAIWTWIVSPEDCSCTMKPLSRYMAHQVGANSLSVCVKGDEAGCIRLLICSGGDDQSICVASLEARLSMRTLTVSSFTRFDGLSASGIKGVELIDANRFVSVGYSQNVALWELSSDLSDVWLLSTIAVDVADVSCLSLLPTNKVIAIGGAGVEIVTLSC